MQEFGAEREAQPVWNQPDFVLQEGAVETDISRIFEDLGVDAVSELVAHEPVPKPPDNLLAERQGEPVLKINVVGLYSFSQGGCVAPVQVVVQLQARFRSALELVRPAGQ